MWQVRGYDTFAREEYLIGEYPTRQLAEAAADAAERRHAEFQDEPLRDRVWIVPPKEDSSSVARPSRAAPAGCAVDIASHTASRNCPCKE